MSAASSIGALQAPVVDRDLERQKLQKAATDFEGVLIASLWKSMRGDGGCFADPNADPTQQGFQDMGIEAVAAALGKAGGLGIGKMVVSHLQPTENKELGGGQEIQPKALKR